MCADNLVPSHSKRSIVAYKAMDIYSTECDSKRLMSLIAGNLYSLGEEYEAAEPVASRFVIKSSKYQKGFHAYKNLRDAKIVAKSNGIAVVRVELSELMFKGEESLSCFIYAPVLVANKCKFVEIVKVYDHVRP